jgi:hypothetical protein
MQLKLTQYPSRLPLRKIADRCPDLEAREVHDRMLAETPRCQEFCAPLQMNTDDGRRSAKPRPPRTQTLWQP